MAAKRAEEPFVMALRALRARLHEGQAGMGARLVATEIAEGLGLSPTPVREALARLAGEGLLEDRRGQGMYVRRLTALDVAHLYRLSLAQLAIAAETPPPPGDPSRAAPGVGEEEDPAQPTDWVAFTETLFLGWVAQAGGRSLALAHVNLQRQLGPVRRIEPLLIGDLQAEAERLRGAAPDRFVRLRLLKDFHGRRVRLAPRIAALLESRAGEASL